jgi:hypothetical protein
MPFFQLIARENPSRPQVEATGLLTLLVERYEESTIRFLLPTQFASCGSFWNNKTSHSVI